MLRRLDEHSLQLREKLLEFLRLAYRFVGDLVRAVGRLRSPLSKREELDVSFWATDALRTGCNTQRRERGVSELKVHGY